MGLLSVQHHPAKSYTLAKEEEGPGRGESLGGQFSHLLVLQQLSTLLS